MAWDASHPVPLASAQLKGVLLLTFLIANSMKRMAESIVVVALIVELAVMFANIVARSIFSSSLLWSLEVSEVALVIIAFMGGAIAYPRNEHMAFNVILDRLSGRWRMAADALVNGQVFLASVLGVWLAFAMMISKWDDRTPYLGLEYGLVCLYRWRWVSFYYAFLP